MNIYSKIDGLKSLFLSMNVNSQIHHTNRPIVANNAKMKEDARRRIQCRGDFTCSKVERQVEL